MNWQEVCADPALQDLPYKIELNRLGQIVMSPASNEHGRFCGEGSLDRSKLAPQFTDQI